MLTRSSLAPLLITPASPLVPWSPLRRPSVTPTPSYGYPFVLPRSPLRRPRGLLTCSPRAQALQLYMVLSPRSFPQPFLPRTTLELFASTTSLCFSSLFSPRRGTVSTSSARFAFCAPCSVPARAAAAANGCCSAVHGRELR